MGTDEKKDTYEILHICDVGAIVKLVDCKHEWVEEYYGMHCYLCDEFHPFGSEPWAPLEDV